MDMQARERLRALSEKEKQTLRLIVRGHDAKSTARSLGLSVHTINERLRDARRKMGVSSSREAARLLLEAEGLPAASDELPPPELLGDMRIGEDPPPPPTDQESAPTAGAGRMRRLPTIIIGAILMTLVLGLLALSALPQLASAPPALAPAPAASDPAPDAQVVDAARQWLELIDQARWEDSYQGTTASFRSHNTLEIWTTVSQRVRAPLGAVISRALVSQENLPAPPNGYEVVKFRTRFADKADVIETVSLAREGDAWRVAGVTIG